MNKIVSSLKNQASPRKFLITGVLVLMVIAACFTLTAATVREITISDSGATVTFRTTKNTVGEALSDADITLSEYDIVNVSLDTPVNEAGVVEISRARDIQIKDGNKEIYTVKSAHDTAEEILEQYNISVDEDDIVTFENSLLSVSYVSVVYQTVNEPVYPGVVYEWDSTLLEGNEVIAIEGVTGSAQVTYCDVYVNDTLSERTESTRTVTAPAVDRVVRVGTKEKIPGVPDNYSKVITCRATAYDGSYETLGKYNPRTALGAVPTVGTVAVDPKVIPLGTKLYITSTDGSYVYGYCFAGDTGGSIKGNRVDLFMGSRREALNFGSRQVNVYVLN